MKAQIKTLSPNNYEVTWEFDDVTEETMPRLERGLSAAGYRPTGIPVVSADGLPMCPRHGVVMRQREKQGDTWYSHSVVDHVTGEVLGYCKGRPGSDSPGWDMGADPAAPLAAHLPPTDPDPRDVPPKASNGGGQGGQPARSQPRPVQAETPQGAPATAAPVDNSPTAYWTIATQLIEAGKLTHPQAGQIATGEGTWAEKAARLLM
jgi:hypothetical protein